MVRLTSAKLDTINELREDWEPISLESVEPGAVVMSTQDGKTYAIWPDGECPEADDEEEE